MMERLWGISRFPGLFSLIGGFRPERSLVELPFTPQLRVVEATCVAERSSAVGTTPPFRGVYLVTAVAPPGRNRALGGMLASCVLGGEGAHRGTRNLHHAAS